MAWLSGYNYRKKITVQTAYLDDALTDFPLYVPITADTDIGGKCRADGYDLRFTASDGTTLLSYERVSFAVAAGAATGIFWVKSSLATSPATDIYCYYGKSDAADGQDAANTWTSYTRVWHLSEAYGTGAGNYKDSCGVGHLTLTDADADSAQGTGIVGKCVDLNGDADYLTDADHADHDPGGAMTIEVWANLDAFPAGTTSFVLHDISNYKWMLTYNNTTGEIKFLIQTASGVTNAIEAVILVIGGWNYLVGTFDKTLGFNRTNLYRNSVKKTPHNSFNENIVAGDEGIDVGGGFGARYIDGLIDEVRYSKDAKSAAWIKFVYRNITEIDNELTWVEEEPRVVTYTLAGLISAQSSITGNTKMLARMAGSIGATSSISGLLTETWKILKAAIIRAAPLRKRIISVPDRERIHSVMPRKRIVTVDKRT